MTPLPGLIDWFEHLSPESLTAIDRFYHPHCYFKDPFNELQQRAALQQLFARMFVSLQQPRFVVTDHLSQGDAVFMVWQFHFYYRQRPCLINGSSHLKFDADGLVHYHRDYWDAAEELYEKLPVLGFVLRKLKKLGH